MYDGKIYSKKGVIHHHETLLKYLIICVHEHKVDQSIKGIHIALADCSGFKVQQLCTYLMFTYSKCQSYQINSLRNAVPNWEANKTPPVIP